MEIKKVHWIGIIFGLIIAALGALFYTQGQKNLFMFFIGIGIVSMAAPFVAEIAMRNKKEEQISEMFLEFSRNLAESVTTGTPISKSITNVSKKNFGPLNPYIAKLANQISIGIPVNRAMQTFAKDVNNPVITRAVGLISEADRAGGEIDYILDSVAKSISEVEKLKKERKAAISSLVIQGYIIFFIFIAIMLVMEFKILPLAAKVGEIGALNNELSFTGQPPGQRLSGEGFSPDKLSNLFLYLLLVQGFFAGFAIGKLTSGTLRAGVKHSFIFMISAFLISTGIRVFAG